MKSGFISRFSNQNEKELEDIRTYARQDIQLLVSPQIFDFNVKNINEQLKFPVVIPNTYDLYHEQHVQSDSTKELMHCDLSSLTDNKPLHPSSVHDPGNIEKESATFSEIEKQQYSDVWDQQSEDMEQDS